MIKCTQVNIVEKMTGKNRTGELKTEFIKAIKLKTT